MGQFIIDGNPNYLHTKDTKVLSGMFRDGESTERAYSYLIEKGYSTDEINLLMSNQTQKRHFVDISEDTEVEAGDYAVKGSDIKEGIVAVGTTVHIEGNEIFIAGPLVEGLEGNRLAGGIIESFVSCGMPEAWAKLYDSGIREGNIVIMLTPKDDADAVYIQSNWKKNQGEEIHF
ncbi:hypothetical protein [Aquiflexum sp.]|uniref:hypothetical protein n=1 Tax=Aquiflexum sp. TaxID=1872584 RepID=UPI003593637A